QPSQRQHDERHDQKIHTRARHRNHERVIAAHVARVRLEHKRSSAQQLDNQSRRSKYPPQLIRGCGGVILLERQSAQQNYRELCAPDHPTPIHTNHLRLFRIMIVASRSVPTINQINSGSLPTSAPPTARSLTRNGIGNGCFTSCALPFGLVTTSRTAMNDVYRVSKLYFRPSDVTSLMFASARSDEP